MNPHSSDQRPDRTVPGLGPKAPSSRTFDRRTLLRTGGLTISLGAVVAACGGSSLATEGPGRIGVAAPTPTLPSEPITDLVLLRTAQSLEYTALDVYALAAGTGALSAEQLELVEAITADHTDHAATLAQVITAGGGEEFSCANPFIVRRVVEPVVAALEGSDDLTRDLLNIAFAVETLAASSYQLFITLLADPALRSAALEIGDDEARHTAALAIAIGGPTNYLSPALFGDEVAPDAEGFPIAYAVPSRFSEVGARELVVGAPQADGSRLRIGIQTPAENSYVYSYMTC